MRRGRAGRLGVLGFALLLQFVAAAALPSDGASTSRVGCVCYDPRTLVAFGGGVVKDCKRSLGRITALTSKAEGGVGVTDKFECGEAPYPSYSHVCMDACDGSGGAYHVGDANSIDSSLDWSDATRFPSKYAAWKEQMPLKENDDGLMQTNVVVSYPEAKPASTSRQASSLREASSSRQPPTARTSTAEETDSSTRTIKAEEKSSAPPKTTHQVATSARSSSAVQRSSSESKTTSRASIESSPQSESSSAESTTSNLMSLTSNTSTASSTSASASSELTSNASAMASESVSSKAANDSTMQAGTTQEVTTESNDASQSSSTWARPIGTNTIVQSMAEVPGKASATVVTYTGLQEGFAVVTGTFDVADLEQPDSGSGLLIGHASKRACFEQSLIVFLVTAVIWSGSV